MNIGKTRFSKLAFSSTTSVFLKAFSFVFSFVIARLVIKSYGSEVNGMLNSIAQFLGFITLLEGGIGGIARAALYKPLSKKTTAEISKIITYIERFFRILALIFVVYAVSIAFLFPYISRSSDYWFTFSLVLILAISSFCEYFFGISYSILITADQKSYFLNILTFIISLLNFIICVVLIRFNASIHLVKIVGVGVLIIKPLFLSFYCRKKYNIQKCNLSKTEKILPQKWDGLGIHIAFYLHRNTDTFLVTIFLSLSLVSVYSVYNMVLTGVLTIIGALSLGVEASLGNIYASSDVESLRKSFQRYVFYYQLLCTILFSATIVLIMPFVRIYTSGITDIDYIQPVFAYLLIAAELFYSFRAPFNDLMIATNSFHSVRIGAYLEVCINVILSIILVNIIGLPGVAIGTIAAMVFRYIHFLCFFRKHVIYLNTTWFVKNTAITVVVVAFNVLVCTLLTVNVGNTYWSWAMFATIVTSFCSLFSVLFFSLFNGRSFKDLLNYFYCKLFSKRGREH